MTPLFFSAASCSGVGGTHHISFHVPRKPPSPGCYASSENILLCVPHGLMSASLQEHAGGQRTASPLHHLVSPQTTAPSTPANQRPWWGAVDHITETSSLKTHAGQGLKCTSKHTLSASEGQDQDTLKLFQVQLSHFANKWMPVKFQFQANNR